MDSKTYIRDYYWKYWITARDAAVCPGAYDRALADLVLTQLPERGRLLDVCVGTGTPFAAWFAKQGFSVTGIDLAPDLIAECRRAHPDVDARIGDGEHLDFPDGTFDAAYCFQSSWYFPSLNRAIRGMLRVTRPDGIVLFDVMNGDNPEVQAHYRRHVREMTGVGRVLRYARQAAKVILKRGSPEWACSVFIHVCDIAETQRTLATARVRSFRLFGREPDDSLALLESPGQHVNYSRLVFAVHRDR